MPLLVYASTLLLFAVFCLRADAATYVVNKASDTNDGVCDADCSLREAVTSANASAGDDEIRFAVASEIELTGGQLEVANNGSLSILGAAGQGTTISGGGRSRIFYGGEGASLSLTGLTMKRGNGRGSQNDGNGGAIAMVSGRVTINECTFTENEASSGGGAVYLFLASVATATNSTFSNNTAATGGAIAGRGSNLSIRRSVFSGNLAHAEGGAISTSGAAVSSVQDSTLSSNSAARGGAIHSRTSINIQSSTLQANIARESNGGALNVVSGILTLSDSRVLSNMAALTGGGIEASRPILRGCLIRGNSAQSIGGGIAIIAGGFFTIENSVIASNSASVGGGISGGGTITGSSIEGNIATDLGGGIFGGGDIISSTISGNRAGGDGGGIRLAGIANLTSVTVVNNRAASGAGVFAPPTGTNLTSRNSIFADNTTDISTQEDIWGTLNSQGHNLIESTLNTIVSGQTETNIIGADPMLEALTVTDAPNYHLPQPNSPVIDKGRSFGLTTDQRFRIRPINIASIPNAVGGDGADIGAVERQEFEGTTTISGRVLTPTYRGLRNATVTLVDAAGLRRTATTSSFGSYTFADIPAGMAYTLVVNSKRYRFAPDSFLLFEGGLNLDFVGQE
jgi:CSLREA domain-containing protein